MGLDFRRMNERDRRMIGTHKFEPKTHKLEGLGDRNLIELGN